MSYKPEAIDRRAPLAAKAIARLARGAKRAATRTRRQAERAALRDGDGDRCPSRVTKGWAD